MLKWLKRVLLTFLALAALAVGALAILLTVTHLPGEEKTPARVRRNTALYIQMKDGVLIAADVWLPRDYQAGHR